MGQSSPLSLPDGDHHDSDQNKVDMMGNEEDDENTLDEDNDESNAHIKTDAKQLHCYMTTKVVLGSVRHHLTLKAIPESCGSCPHSLAV